MRSDTVSKIAASPSPIRVLHTLEATLGGTMRYLHNVLEASGDLPLEFGFAYATSRADHQLPRFLAAAQSSGWQLFPFHAGRAISPSSDLAATGQLTRIIRLFRPAIIHCHSSKAGALGRIAAKLALSKAAIVYSPHAIAAPLGAHYLLVERALAKITDRFMAVSESEKQQLLKLRLCSEAEVDVVYPMVDCQYFQPRSREAARADLHLKGSPFIVGIGRATAQKDPSAFLEIVALASKKIPDLHAAWVGGGPELDHLQGAIRNKGLQDRVRLLPWLQDVRPYLASANVLLSTSRFESFGYMVAEALAMETPVVATAITGTTDVMVGDLSQSLYEPGDLESAARLVCQMLENGKLAGQLGVSGRQSVLSRFGTSRFKSSLIASYGKLLGYSNTYLAPRQEVW